MNRAAAQKLISLNRQFYQTFALQFASTRQRLQPGVRRVLSALSLQEAILDLGCGNGQLWLALQKAGYGGQYVGVDSSLELIEIARQAASAAQAGQPVFIEADLSDSDWLQNLPAGPESTLTRGFSTIFAFAVLHHLPGIDLRLAVLKQVRNLLDPTGCFIHSEWQFLNSPRLTARIQPWSLAGLDPAELDPGDYLLDWRSGGQGLRYVHLFDEHELAELARQAGFDILETFFSDGKSGNLALYQTWRALPA